jgi:hypothetical protein
MTASEWKCSASAGSGEPAAWTLLRQESEPIDEVLADLELRYCQLPGE